MSKQMSALFGALAAGLETAAAAARQLENTEEISDAKSPSPAVDAVASAPAEPKAKAAATPGAVASKPAKGGKNKAPAVTFDVLKAKLTELVNTKGKEAAKEILSGFGAPKLIDLDDENYADAYAAAVAAMAEPEPAAATEEDDDMFGE